MMMYSQLCHTTAFVVMEVAIMMTSSQLRHTTTLVVIIYKWKRNDNESEGRRAGNKVTERERGVPSYVSKPRSNVEGAEGQGRIKGEDCVEEPTRGPGSRHGGSHRNALGQCFSLV